MDGWAGDRKGRKRVCVTKLGRPYQTGFISVSREPSNTRFQLAVPLAGLGKHQQPNREIKTIFLLVGVIFEAHF